MCYPDVDDVALKSHHRCLRSLAQKKLRAAWRTSWASSTAYQTRLTVRSWPQSRHSTGTFVDEPFALVGRIFKYCSLSALLPLLFSPQDFIRIKSTARLQTSTVFLAKQQAFLKQASSSTNPSSHPHLPILPISPPSSCFHLIQLPLMALILLQALFGRVQRLCHRGTGAHRADKHFFGPKTPNEDWSPISVTSTPSINPDRSFAMRLGSDPERATTQSSSSTSFLATSRCASNAPHGRTKRPATIRRSGRNGPRSTTSTQQP